MMRTIIVPVLATGLLTEAALAAPDFARDIRPILSETCFACHGQDARKRKAKLRLDQSESALAERDGVQAIVPGDLENSEAWIRITSKDEDEVMPPRDSHKQLSDAEKELLRQWILQGAQYQEHWAFIAPKKPVVPKGSANPVDAFLQQRLAREGLKPAPLAEPEILVRRIYLDLTGLPPGRRKWTPSSRTKLLRLWKP